MPQDLLNEYHRFMEIKRMLIGNLLSVRANINKQFDPAMERQCSEDITEWMHKGLRQVEKGCGLEAGYKAQIQYVGQRITDEITQHCLSYNTDQPKPATTHSAQPTNN